MGRMDKMVSRVFFEFIAQPFDWSGWGGRNGFHQLRGLTVSIELAKINTNCTVRMHQSFYNN
eukprot:1282583-Amphidinium_carterae.1